MTREKFLEKYWLPYPVAPSNVVNSSAFLAGRGDVWVGGRLEGSLGGWRLSSNGVSVPIEFIASAGWSKVCLRQESKFDQDQLMAGDVIAVDVGEKSQKRIAAREVCLLAPNLAPESDQTNLKDFPVSRAIEWAAFVARVRAHFAHSGFIECRTPTLVASPGTEPFLDAFETQLSFGSKTEKVYLPTSPEFHLKKLLVAGFTDIFEFKDCFRNHEGGRHHQAEFLMLEWYRAYSNLEAIANDVEFLFDVLAQHFGKAKVELKRTTVARLFKDRLNFDLTPHTTREELIALANANSVYIDAGDRWDDLYFRIFLEKIEPLLETSGPWLVQNYPPSQSALARLTHDGWADRFEIYWNGLEIANAFHELNDPKANEARFKKDNEDRLALAKSPVPHDTRLVTALYAGMPPAGGIALGMDRLFMALLNIKSIEETRAFPVR